MSAPGPTSSAASPSRTGPPIMIALGIGWMGTQVFWAFHTGTMPLYLKEHTESKLWVSLVLSLAGLTGCTIPPIVGYLSDRTRSRFGRRAPYIVGGMAVAAVCLVAMRTTTAFAAIAALSAMTYLAVNVAQAPYLSLMPDVTPADQRGTASGVMNLCGSLGLIAYFATSAALWETNPGGVFAIVAVVMFAAVLVPALTLRSPATPPAARKGGLRAHLASLLEEKPLLILLIASGFCWLAHWMSVTFFTLFVVESLGASEGESQYVPMAFGIVATVAALPMGIAGDRFGRKRVLTTMVAVWVVGVACVALAQTLTHAVLFAALSAIPFSALMVVGYAFMLDLIPPDRTAELLGLSFITSAAPQMIGPVISGAIIDNYGYRAVFPAAAVVLLVALVVLLQVPTKTRREA